MVPVTYSEVRMDAFSRSEVRNAGRVQFDGDDVERWPFVFSEGQFGQPAFPHRGIVREIVENEIAEAVDDGPVLVPLHGLRDVGVAAHDGVGTSVDQPVRKCLLLRGGLLVGLLTPMQEQQHDVGLLARALDIANRVLLIEPGRARRRRAGLE